MNSRYLTPLVAALLLVGLLLLSAFSVDESEFALRTRFGQQQPGEYAPGLHWSWPFERVVRIDRRVFTARMMHEPFLSSEQQALAVDVLLNWRVSDPAVYLRTVGADEKTATDRLQDAVRGELKPQYAQRSLTGIIAASDDGIAPALLIRLQATAAALGIALLDVRVQRVDASDDVNDVIFRRMQGAYADEARQLRAEAVAEADRLRAEAERNRAEILAAANREAQRLRGEGDAQAAAIYARSYGANPEFAAFYRSLQAYRTALGRDGDILVIEPEGEFYKYLHSTARH